MKSGLPQLTIEELNAWIRYIQELTGIALDESKRYLIETRIGTFFQEAGAKTWSELLYKIKTVSSLRNKLIDAITTKETSFFRDASPFEMLQYKLLPDLLDRRRRSGIKPIPIRILSAACSTGQEVYSIAIVIKEVLGDFGGYDIRILGLDISDEAIAKASYAHYSRLELDRGLPPDKLAKYFDKVGDNYKVKDELRALASFRRANLLEPISTPYPFDIIFCRNVAIYFSEPDKVRLFKNLSKVMASDGALIIGATEIIGGLCPEFESHRWMRAVYYTKKA